MRRAGKRAEPGIPGLCRSLRAGLWAVCILALLAPAVGCREDDGSLPLMRLRLGETEVLAEVPLTREERVLGLGGRGGLAPGRAMVFMFAPPVRIAMTMNNMRFPLDFLWVLGGRVVEITAEVPPDLEPGTVIRPAGPVDMVIEAPSGWAQANGVDLGAPLVMEVADPRGRNAELVPLLAELARRGGLGY